MVEERVEVAGEPGGVPQLALDRGVDREPGHDGQEHLEVVHEPFGVVDAPRERIRGELAERRVQ